MKVGWIPIKRNSFQRVERFRAVSFRAIHTHATLFTRKWQTNYNKNVCYVFLNFTLNKERQNPELLSMWAFVLWAFVLWPFVRKRKSRLRQFLLEVVPDFNPDAI